MDYGTVMLLEDAPNIKVSLCLNLKTPGSFHVTCGVLSGFQSQVE